MKEEGWRRKDEERKKVAAKIRAREQESGFLKGEWWEKYFDFHVPRSVLDPNDTIRSIEDVAWFRQRWLKEKGFESAFSLRSVDVREYPEAVDPTIRDLAIRINNLLPKPFIKTLDSCSGHGKDDPESKFGLVGYEHAGLLIIINRNLPDGEKFLGELIRLTEEFSEPLSEILFRRSPDHELKGEEGVEVYAIDFRLGAPTRGWLDKYHKPYFVPQPESSEEKTEFDKLLLEVLEKACIPQNDKSVQHLDNSYFNNFAKEYGGYPTSEESKKRTEEFWKKVGELVDRFSTEY